MFAAVTVAALGACSSNDSTTVPAPASATTSALASSTTTTTAPAATTTTAPAFACTMAAGKSNATIQSGGVTRTYQLGVPSGLSAPAPLVFNLHGFGSNANEQAVYTGLTDRGIEAGMIVVTPDGSGNPQHWNYIPAAGEPDDYLFVTDMLDTISTSGCVDATRVYATGISAGSAMSAFLACRLHGRLAAVALVAATVQPVGCPDGTRMPVLAFHGTADPLVPYQGGSLGGLPVKPAEEAIADWAAADGCQTTPTSTAVASDVTLLDFPGCPDGLAVQLYRIEDGGHTWPDGIIDLPQYGNTTRSISATALILSFFAAHTGTH